MERESEEWKFGERKEERKKGVGWRSNLEERGYGVCISPSLCPHCAQSSWGLVCDREEEQLGLINHNGN